MTKVTNEEHQFNGDISAGDTVAMTINGNVFKEYTVKTGYEGKVTFMYEEDEIKETTE